MSGSIHKETRGEAHNPPGRKIYGSARPTAILVLGTPCSGASRLNRLLNLLGVDLPQVLKPDKDYNASGHWESEQLMCLHNEMFHAAGSFRDDWTQIDPAWFDSSAAGRFKKRIFDMLEANLGRSSLFAINDPLVCRIVPFWIDVLDSFGADTVCLLAVRNPHEVAASLHRGDGFMQSKSYLLWLRHMLDAELSSREIPRLITIHDDLLANWRSVADNISSKLNIAFPRRTANADAEICALLHDDYRRQQAEKTALNVNPVFAEWGEIAFDVIQGLARQDDAPQARARLDTLREEFNRTSRIFGSVARSEGLQRRECESENSKLRENCRILHEEMLAQRRRLEAKTRIFEEEKRAAVRKIIEEQNLEGERGNNYSTSNMVYLLKSKEQADALALQLNALQTSAAWSIAKQIYWLELRQPRVVRAAVSISKMIWWMLRGRLRERLRLREDAKQIVVSGLFDESQYITSNPDILQNPIQPLLHWIIQGWREGRNPHFLFDTAWYLPQVPQLIDGGVNPLKHYLTTGGSERLDPSPLFDAKWYIEQHHEVAASKVTPLEHYLNHGASKGWSPCPLFDIEYYLQQSPDVVAAKMNPLLHYIKYGAAAGRNPNRLFDSAWYLNQYPEVSRTDMNPLVHYIMYGARERLDPGPNFDTAWYLAEYQDVSESQLSPLAHHLLHGVHEGRKPNPSAIDSWGARHELDAAILDAGRTLARQVRAWGTDSQSPWPAATAMTDSILVVDRSAPTPDRDSGSFRMQHILGALVDLGLDVVFVGDQKAEGIRYVQDLANKDITVIEGIKDALSFLAYQGVRFKAVFLVRPEIAYKYLPMVRAYAVNATVFYDTVDLHWIRFERGANITDNNREMLNNSRYYKRVELANARAADVTLAISEDEGAQLLAEDASLTVRTLPNVFESVENQPGFESRRDLLFIGGFAHAPNVDAVNHLVSEVMPLIIDKLGDVKLHIIGSDMPRALLDLRSDHVNPIGYVPDVTAYFNKSRVFVAPLRYGAGMKGKVGQSLSYGVPVVTSRIGAEGVGLVNGKSAFISDNIDEFADHVARLYNDKRLWETLSREGLALIESRYSRAVVRDKLRSWIDGLGRTGQKLNEK